MMVRRVCWCDDVVASTVAVVALDVAGGGCTGMGGGDGGVDVAGDGGVLGAVGGDGGGEGGGVVEGLGDVGSALSCTAGVE